VLFFWTGWQDFGITGFKGFKG